MAHIVEHLSVAELEARYRAAQDAAEARHFQAIWLLARGRTVLEVSEVLAFVPRWVARHLGLAQVHPQRGWEALKRIGWSIQAPRPRHARAAAPEKRAAFKGGSMPLSLGPGRRTRTRRARS